MNRPFLCNSILATVIALGTACGGGGETPPDPEPNPIPIPTPKDPIINPGPDPIPTTPEPPSPGVVRVPAIPLAAVVVDPTVEYVTFEGFGTSLAWFGNVIGRWQEPGRTAVADLLFDPEQGLGINIARYNIGGGENPAHDHMRAGGEMEGFQPSEGVWDWSADPGQRWMLEAVKARAGDAFIAEAFANSPPYWMTYSQCAAGNDPGTANALISDRFDDFADYLTTVAEYFSANWGIDFRTIEPLNEPEADWWRAYNGQEGAHFNASAQAQIVRELDDTIAGRALPFEVAAMDAAGIGAAIDNYQAYNAATRASLTQINVHGYHGTAEERHRLRNLARSEGKRLWLSESDGGGLEDAFAANTHDPDAIGPGLDLAKRIYQVMRELQPDAWVFWQAVENWPNQVDIRKNWGLVLADFTANGSTNAHLRTTKKYHVMAQYSKYIRPGDRMIQINDPESLAFVSEEGTRLTIVKAHPGASNRDFEVDLSRFYALPDFAQTSRTSPFENQQTLPDTGIRDGVLEATLTPQSITTFVIDQVAFNQGKPVSGPFRLINRNSDKCMSVSSPELGNPVAVQTDCGNDEAQIWHIRYLRGGTYALKHASSDRHLTLGTERWAAGTRAVLADDNPEIDGGPWLLLDQGDGYFHIAGAESLMLLDINSASQGDGAEVLQWYDNGGSNQDWRLELHTAAD